MANSFAVRAFGTILKLGDGATPVESFANVPEVVEYEFPTPTREEIDVTHHESPGEYREFIGSFKDAGSLTFTVNWNPNNAIHKQLIDLFEAGTTVNWQVAFPVSPTKTAAFSAYVSSYQPMPPIDGALRAQFILRVSGQISGLGT